jgi:hypothetical protein
MTVLNGAQMANGASLRNGAAAAWADLATRPLAKKR